MICRVENWSSSFRNSGIRALSPFLYSCPDLAFFHMMVEFPDSLLSQSENDWNGSIHHIFLKKRNGFCFLSQPPNKILSFPLTEPMWVPCPSLNQPPRPRELPCSYWINMRFCAHLWSNCMQEQDFSFFFFFPTSWRCNWHTTLCEFKVCHVTIWYMYCEMFITIRLVNTPFNSHNYYFVIVFAMVSTLKLYSHSTFQV